MILQIDAGNSRVHWRLLDEHRDVSARGDQPWEGVSATGLEPVSHERLTGVEFASVAGERAERLKATLTRDVSVPVRDFVVQERQCGLVNAYRDPARMGVDRWLAMIGGFRSFGGPLTVMDAGTAITIDYVDARGFHRGGYILPGLAMMEASLGAGTSGVRADPLTEDGIAPGTSTAECVHHGLGWLLGTMVTRAGSYWEHGGRMIVTGGDAGRLAAYPEAEVILERDLVFLGMDAVVSDDCF